jgi:pimeloyl-ACP methyl ester carboxylesterase
MDKTIYLIPGVGANDKIFENLELGDYEIVHLKWPKHRKDEHISSYVKKLVPQIKKDTQPILIGMSFGGVVAVELAKLVKPHKTIIISSIKTYHERPLKFLLLSSLKFHRLIPGKLAIEFRFWLQWFLGKLSSHDFKMIDDMIKEINVEFNEWAVDQVINWRNEEYPENITHIHGTRDRIFPHFYIKDAIWIKGGTHFMVVNRAKEISKIIRKELSSALQFKLPRQAPKQLKKAS